MAKKHMGRWLALAAVAGAAAVGISYFRKYRSFNKELEEDFHDFEDEGDDMVAEEKGISEGSARKYVSLHANKDEFKVAAGDMLGAAKDMAYMYQDFDLTVSTNEKGKEIVWDINFKTDKVQTEEGLKIGDTPAKVKQLYPSAKENYGLYTATLGNTQVIVDCGMKNDKVVGISYQYYEAK